jgi:hypothetical protein
VDILYRDLNRFMFENTLTYKNALDNAILQSDIVAIFDNLLTISVEE